MTDNLSKINIDYLLPECDKGWYNLINVGLSMLNKYDIQFTCIKEKFGGLRIYFNEIKELSDVDYDKVSNIIQYMEKLSYKTCEICGSPGSLNVKGNGYLKTLCDNHASEFNFSSVKNMK